MIKAKLKQIEDLLFEGYQAYQGLAILNNPDSLDRILALSNATLKRATPADVEKLAEHIPWTPEAVSAVESRYRLKIPSVTELLEKPKGSLGHEFGRFLENQGIDPRDVTPPTVTDDLSYLVAHLSETHDLWHLLTGFGTDLDGEAGVAAFAAAQYASPFQYSIIAGALLTGVRKDPWQLHHRMTSAVKGWQMGTDAYLLLGIRWDDYWSEQLASLRRKFTINC